MKVSIVMGYFNRKFQILETLKGFQKMYAGKYNFEVVIVDDNSNDEHRLEEDIKQFTFPIHLIVISAKEKGDRVNPCIAYNRGFAEATGDIIIIQNPECYHVGDIILYTVKNLSEQDYFSYSCFTANSVEISNQMIHSSFEDIKNLLSNDSFMKKNKGRMRLNWYNHDIEKHRQVYYHFCCAIYKSKLDLIGGFDARFASGYGFDDDELVLSIKYILKLNMKIINTEKCFVIHQYHTRNVAMNCKPNRLKWNKNKSLYESLKKEHEKNNFQYPKLMFLYWDGSPLSYLNYLTVVSFNYYNPVWKIIVYKPTKRTTAKSWKTDEMKYEGVDHFDKLYNIPNVIVKSIDLDKIGFNEDALEVIKSDYFKYYILEKHGGLWSDFDIMYTASIENRMHFIENTVIFKCPNRIVPNGPIVSHYFPIGLFLCKPKNKFFSYIKNQSKQFYDPDHYQSIGSNMWNKLFHTSWQEVKHEYKDISKAVECWVINNKIYNIDNSIKICNESYYLPWAWNELSSFLGDGSHNNKLPQNNVGIHWFNGASESKKYSIQLENRLSNLSINCLLDFEVNKHHKKISIVTAYYNIKPQILETLKGFQKMYTGKYNFEVVIVDDNSNDEHRLEEDIKQFTFPINLIVISAKEKGDRVNPCIAYNRGFAEATGDIIIIQNPEIYHCGDIIEYILQNSLQVENNYVTFPVFSSPSFKHNTMLYKIQNEYYNNFVQKINYEEYDFNYEYYINKYPEFKYMTPSQAESDYLENGIKLGRVCNSKNIYFKKNVIYEWKGWYNHYVNNPCNRHFLSVISKDNLNKIGGFCNRFKYGLQYDDDFVDRIRNITNVINLDSAKYFGVHQYHLSGSDDQRNYNNVNQLIQMNSFEFNKKNNIVFCSPLKVGLCFKIYVNEKTKAYRYEIIKTFLESLEKLLEYNSKLEVIGIIDCKINNQLKYIIDTIDTKKIHIINLNKNYGISYATNIGIIELINKNCHYIFCSDDDIIFKKKNIFDEYIKCSIKHNINHLAFYPKNIFNCMSSTKINEDIECVDNVYSGCFYMLRKQDILNKGLLPLLDSKYGYEHKILTRSLTGKQFDLINSDDYIELNKCSLECCSGSKLYESNINKKPKEFKLIPYNKMSSISKSTDMKLIINNTDIKISIVMAYYNRKKQTLQTLKGFENMYAGKYDFEVIIVDDNSNDENKLEENIKQFTFPINLIVISAEEKGERINPCTAYNKGFIEATGDIIIIQNPEILHCGDIIEYCLKNSNEINKNYVTLPVFSSPSFKHNKILNNIKNDYYKNFVQKINYEDFGFNYKYYINKYKEFAHMLPEEAEKDYLKNGIKHNRVCNKKNIFHSRYVIRWKGWYNHKIYNPRNLHFLSIISRNNLSKIGGFCNDFKYGLWYDDNDFLNRIKKITNVITLDSKEYFGIHQFHKSGSDDQHIHTNFNKLVQLNKNIYNNNINNNIIYCSQGKIGLCFKLYINEYTNTKRFNIIEEFIISINNIIDTNKNIEIVGVIDCKLNNKLEYLINKLNSKIKIKYLNKNYGISYATNTGIVELINKDCEFIFCSDDDVIIKDPKIFDEYIKCSIKHNINHLGYYPIQHFNVKTNKINEDVNEISGYSGCFYMLKRCDILNKGLLPILDSKYGYEHEIFTRSLTGKQYDIINSGYYIELNKLSIDVCSGSKLQKSNINKKPNEFKLIPYDKMKIKILQKQ